MPEPFTDRDTGLLRTLPDGWVNRRRRSSARRLDLRGRHLGSELDDELAPAEGLISVREGVHDGRRQLSYISG